MTKGIGWDAVRNAVQDAAAITWDGCHKIYVLMDYGQVDKMHEYGYKMDYGSADEMFDLLSEWYDDSCGLRFISAMRTTDGPEEGYAVLIPQGWEETEGN